MKVLTRLISLSTMALTLVGNGYQSFESFFKLNSPFKIKAESNSGSVAQSDTMQNLGFDPTTSAGLELAASIYFVPENELLYRMRFPNGDYREFEKRHAYSTRPIQELWSPHGWMGFVREKEGLIFVKSGTNVEGGEVQFLFKNGRLIQLEQNGKVFKIPYGAPRKPTQGGFPFFFSNGFGNLSNDPGSPTKRQSSGIQKHNDRIYAFFDICHIDGSGNVSITLKKSAGCPLSGVKFMEGDVPILITNGQARVNGDNPGIWIVDDGKALGGVLACGDIRWYYHRNPASPAVGYVHDIKYLPDEKIHRLVLAGDAGDAWLRWMTEGGEERQQNTPDEVVFISPPFPPSALPEGFLQSCKVTFLIGEFAARYSPDEFQNPPAWVTIIKGMELYHPGWMAFVAGK